MYETICQALLETGVRLVYTTSRSVDKTLKNLANEYPACHSELVINEKVAYELALAGSYAAKRTACLFSTTGLYDALDPLMSSAYTGVVGGCLIVCVRETDEEIGPLGPFSKLPVIVSNDSGSFMRSVEYGYTISETYEIPVLLQTVPEVDDGSVVRNPSPVAMSPSRFVRNPARWAATPKFRYQLHGALNEKIERIREDFETYPGNVVTKGSSTGIVTTHPVDLDFYDDEASVFLLSTIFPAPLRSLSAFMGEMDHTLVLEGEYPVLELQVEKRETMTVERFPVPPDRKRQNENIAGFKVVRDWLGPGSSLNIGHGMRKTDPVTPILAITFEDYFFHSGMAATVNVLYNQSRFVILILTREREDEIRVVLQGLGVTNIHTIRASADIEAFKGSENLTVILFRGIL